MSRQITIKIQTGNAAFDDGNEGREVARILQHYAKAVEVNGEAFAANLIDVNGNTVGHAKIGRAR